MPECVEGVGEAQSKKANGGQTPGDRSKRKDRKTEGTVVPMPPYLWEGHATPRPVAE